VAVTMLPFFFKICARGGTGSLSAVHHLKFRSLERCVQRGKSNATVKFLFLVSFFCLLFALELPTKTTLVGGF